jgi:hypothetical protein
MITRNSFLLLMMMLSAAAAPAVGTVTPTSYHTRTLAVQFLGLTITCLCLPPLPSFDPYPVVTWLFSPIINVVVKPCHSLITY